MLEQIYQSTIDFEKKVKKADRKSKGQFFTPLKVAEFMASLSLNISEELRVLDCGAGTGILACALLEKLLKNTLIEKVVLDLYENDSVVLGTLRENTDLMVNKYRENNKELIVNIKEENFITSNKQNWDNEEFEGLYDIVIANPPYKKLAKDSDESQSMLSVVYGQPNIYFLFMAMSTKLLKRDGEMIFITPRSFTSGAYFKSFRDYWLNQVSMTDIHIFVSRTEVFNKEEVLQEAIITRAVKNPNRKDNIRITASDDADLEHSAVMNVDYNTIVDLDTVNKYILIPSSQEEVAVLETVHKWQYNLVQLGFKIKTGPVVDFRSREWIRENPDQVTVPLIYAGHYSNYYINFPLPRYKDFQYIVNIPDTQYLMLENKNYLLVKRLTAKEETRRLQCAIYLQEGYPQYQKIGIENHINYLAKLDGDITQEELYGMFCLFNSSILDTYYRIMNGNTQVNATEANAIPLPGLDTICLYGKKLLTKDSMNTETCDRIIEEINSSFELNLIQEVAVEAMYKQGGMKMGKKEEAKQILIDLGMPKQQQNDRSAWTLLSLLGLREDSEWSEVYQNELGINQIIEFIAENYGKRYATNSREAIRKYTIHQFIQGAIAIQNVDEASRATNSPKYSYRITDEALEVFRAYGSDEWKEKLQGFISKVGTLSEEYAQNREMVKIPVKVNDEDLQFSPGKHNELQKAIIEEFAPRFAPNAEVLYVGDTAKKDLVKNTDKLQKLGVRITAHDKLPDVVLYRDDKDWIYFIEAVTSVGPVSVKRRKEIEEMLENCNCGIIYVTAFLDMTAKNGFKKYIEEIAWETEIWVADQPSHMIHLNGDRFMGPR